MRFLYLEANAINRAHEVGMTGGALRALLMAHEWSPVVGLHVVYELARGFLHSDHADSMGPRFEIMRDLEPRIGRRVMDILVEELSRLRTGAAVDVMLSGTNLESAIREIASLATGTIREDGELFIAGREEEASFEFPELCRATIEAAPEVKRRAAADGVRLRTFDDVFAVVQPDVPAMIRSRYGGALTAEECSTMASRLDEFPCLRTVVRADIYITFICTVHERQPAKDKLDDFRHVIEAAYCDGFVTHDARLQRATPRLNHRIEVVPWPELEAWNAMDEAG